MFKKLAIGIGVIVVAAVVGLYYVVSNAPAIIKAQVEEHGSRATQVAVTLDGVDLNLSEYYAGIRGLSVGNPTGFKTERAMGLGDVSIKLADNWSMYVIVIEEIMVRAPEITYEIGGDGSNIARIQENVDNFIKALGGGDSGAAQPSDSGEAGPKVVINNLYIKDGRVNVSATLFEGKALGTPLPDIHLTDIGKDEGGASPAEVVDEIITAITGSANSAASGVDLSQLGLADITGKAAGMAQDAMEAVGGAAGGAGESLGGAAEGAVEGIKGLFGN